MKAIIANSILWLIRWAWRVRYRVTYKGIDEITQSVDRKKGTLFLPNHPAVFIDPLIISEPAIRKFSARPLIVEYMYYNPCFHWAASLVHALPIPNFATGFNPIKLQRTKKQLQQMSDGLKKGESFLIYPSGTTKIGPREVLGGAFGTHQLISENPNVNIVLVRLTGLWGSVFSRALTAGEVADTWTGLKKALRALIECGLFFMPKREVVCEFEMAPRDFPRHGTLEEINRYLEEWYNKPFMSADGTNLGEPIKLVSYSCWKEKLPEVQPRIQEEADLALMSKTSEETQQKIISKIAELARIPKENIATSQNVIIDLGLDSLDLADLVTFIADEFQVAEISPGDITTVARCCIIASGLYQKKEVEDPRYNLTAWLRPTQAERLYLPEARSIPEAFLKLADKHPNRVICADPQRGLLTYFDVKRRAFLLAEKIRDLPGKRVGVLLPATTTVHIIVLACHIAGKVPVMINWTVGGKHLDTVVEVAGIESVLTSWSFLDKLDNVDISRIEPMLLVLEELRVAFSVREIARSVKYAYTSHESLLERKEFAHLKNAFHQEAVVLFTSGTEANPKGVPLTHGNLLDNQRAILESIEITSDDVMLAILPPFHSFGFAITGIMPFICGLKVVFYPNPIEAKRIAKGCDFWKPTIICSAPSFLKNIFRRATPDMLASIRLIVSGAEKASAEFLQSVQAMCPQAFFCEGYGITECSPVLTLNSVDNTQVVRACGVGRPLDRVELCIVHPETYEPMPRDLVGLICARGPNIFMGYLNKDVHSPFIECATKKWYNTGDLGKLLDDGSLVLAGRLKRFVKVGGEMISLAAIEDVFLPLVQEKQNGNDAPHLAVVSGGEAGDRPKLSLFIGNCPGLEVFSVVDANQMLRTSGFSNLVKIDNVVVMKELPITGTGKIAYRQLEKQCIT